jgi:Helitron helicase-like domain at N-terminus
MVAAIQQQTISTPWPVHISSIWRLTKTTSLLFSFAANFEKAFLQHQDAFRNLTPKDLEIVSSEESRKIPFSNPTVRALRSQLSAVRAKVMGTDESRIKICAQIKGMNTIKGPPSLWITINPSDVGDPIAQIYVGEQIDLDNFDKTMGPNSSAHNLNMAGDPYAAAKFFHYVIATLLEELFGIKAHNKQSHMKHTSGVFGKVASYIGTVEAQGRGTLHLHIVVWLVGSLTHVQMKAALKSKAFRNKIKSYITANIRTDLDGADKNGVICMPRKTAVSYSRPIDPRRPDYSIAVKTAELEFARTVQHHMCSKDTCLVSKKGSIYCKRRAPFDLSSRDYVDEDGSWGPKRTYKFINSWCPPIMQCMRSNQDIKLITSGAETINISFYISLYVAKQQANSSNASALLAKKLAFHKARERYNSDITKLNKHLLQKCVNTLTREQEFSGLEVVSYLMGWGDRFISHYFITIYWSSVAGAIHRKYPSIKVKQ